VTTRLLEAFGLERGVVALAGAGGKTTLLFRLAGEAHAAGRRVLVTTTTHMGVPVGEGAVVYDEHDVAAALERTGRVTLLGRRVRDDKVAGISPERVDALRGLADLVLVEADGARRRSFKIPADHEPVVPSSTGLLVVVAGLDVLGKPLGAEHVHRWERVAEAAAQAVGSPVTEDTLVRALCAPTGYLSRLPPGARSAVFLNKAEDAPALLAAARIAARLVPRYGLALAGSARRPR
jgi:probable selenium-dependent hydroxylase accessory protein YqeC